MSTDVLNSFFNPNVEQFKQEEKKSDEFKPSPKAGRAGVYQALVRFLPNPADPSNKSIVSKWTCYLTNPITNSGMTIDCYSSVGKPDIIKDMFFKLRNSESEVDKEKSKAFSSRQRFATLVQVLACDSHPELVNRILVWRFGQKVYQKIYDELNPSYADPINPYDMINGRPFLVKVVEVSGYPNFDQCKFMNISDKTSKAMKIIVKNRMGQEQVVPVTSELIANEKGRELVFNYLKDNAPSLDPYEFNEWDQTTQEFVTSVIKLYTEGYQKPETVSFSDMMNQQKAAPAKQPVQTMPQAAPQQKSKPAEPLAGLELGLSETALDTPATDTDFDVSDIDVDALINNAAPTTGNKGSEDSGNPNSPINLDDVLNGAFLV